MVTLKQFLFEAWKQVGVKRNLEKSIRLLFHQSMLKNRQINVFITYLVRLIKPSGIRKYIGEIYVIFTS